MDSVEAILRQEIQAHGSISFARFMEVALYCPNIGYYEREPAGPGRQGDYYTSVSVGPLFGELLAAQFADWKTEPGDPGNPALQLVEAGAHDGRLAADILGWFRQQRPGWSVQYMIVEPSARRRRWQERTLDIFAGQVEWFASFAALPGGVRGIIFCNELLDALPFRLLEWRGGRWLERRVACNNQQFIWELVEPPKSLPTPEVPPELARVLPEGFFTEVSTAAMDWWQEAASALERGKLVAIDYGLERERFLAPERAQGTARAYHRHHLSGELLANPGAQDITSHVNFTALREMGEQLGLRTESFLSQAQFLTRIVARAGALPTGAARQFQTLTHPDHLGRSFKVLVQSR